MLSQCSLTKKKSVGCDCVFFFLFRFRYLANKGYFKVNLHFGGCSDWFFKEDYRPMMLHLRTTLLCCLVVSDPISRWSARLDSVCLLLTMIGAILLSVCHELFFRLHIIFLNIFVLVSFWVIFCGGWLWWFFGFKGWLSIFIDHERWGKLVWVVLVDSVLFLTEFVMVQYFIFIVYFLTRCWWSMVFYYCNYDNTF